MRMQYFTFKELTTSREHPDIDNKISGMIADRLYKLVVNLLDPIRKEYGKPIKVTSGYRSKALNIAVNGSSSSAHLLGYAVDIIPADGDILGLYSAVLKITKQVPFDQVIFENCRAGHLPSWIHLGLYNSAFEQRKQYLREYKGKYYDASNFPYE